MGSDFTYPDLTRMSRADLLKLRELVDHRLEDYRKPDDLVVVYRWMEEALKRRGITSPPYSLLKKQSWFSTFKAGAEHLDAFINQYFQVQRRAERYKLYLRVGDLLITDMVERGVPVSPRALATSLTRTSQVIDLAFPGYRESGLLNVIIKGQL